MVDLYEYDSKIIAIVAMKRDEYGNNFNMFFIAYRNISTIDFGNFASVIFLLFLLISYVLLLINYLS